MKDSPRQQPSRGLRMCPTRMRDCSLEEPIMNCWSLPYRLAPVKYLLLCALVAGTASAQPVEVPLKNPSFEEGLDRIGVPVGWQRYLNPRDADGIRQMSLVQAAADGTQALLLHDSSADGEIGIRQVVPVEPGVTYEASVSIRAVRDAPSSGAILLMRFSPAGRDVVVHLRPRSHEHFDRVKAINTAPPEAKTMSLYLYSHRAPTPQLIMDNVKLLKGVEPPPPPPPPPPEPVPPVYSKLKDLHPQTELVKDGKPNAAIVAPKSGIYAEQANQIQQTVRELTAVEIPIIDDESPGAAVPIEDNLIALGNRSTNKTIEELYNRYHTLLDLRYPGPGGHVVRTLHSPFGDGHNVLFVGGSDTNGVASAAGVLVKTLQQRGALSIGWLAEIHLGSGTDLPTDVRDFEIWEASRGYRSIGYFGWNSISKHMAMYYMTGNEHSAREVIRLAFPDAQAKKEIAEIDGERIENKDEPLSGTYHYNSHMMILYWDLIEESPVFTDEERLRVTNAFSRQLLHRKGERVYSATKPPTCVGSRHGQWSALSLYCLGRYFQKDYPDPIWAQCERAGQLHFGSLHKYLWVVGEFDCLPWFSTGTAPILTYLLLTGDRKPLENRVLREQLRGQEILTDGSKPDPHLSSASLGFLHKAAYLFQDGRFVHYRHHAGVDTEVFRLGQSFWPEKHLASGPPADLVGKWSVLHMSEPAWRARRTGFDIESTFRFASYRNSVDDSGDYVFLKGINRQLRNPYHNFALLRLRINGKTLLNGYGTQVYTRADGMVEPNIAMNGALRHRDVIGGTVVAVGEVPDLAYCNWRRTLALRTGRYAVLADTLTFRTDSDNINAQITWQRDARVNAAITAPGVLSLSAGAGPTTVREGWFEVRAVLAPCTTNMKSSDATVKLHGYDTMLMRSTEPGQWLELPFTLKKAAAGEVLVDFLKYGDRGVVRLYLDGRPVGSESYDLYANGVVKQRVALGRLDLAAGEHRLRVETVAVKPPRKKSYVPLMGLSIKSDAFTADDAQRENTYDLCLCDPVQTTSRRAITTMDWNGRGRKGEQQVFFTALALNPSDPAKRAACSRLAPNAAALALPEPALAVAGTHEGIDCEFALLAGSHLFGKALKEAGIEGTLVRSNVPVDIDWDFVSGRVEIVTREAAKVELFAKPGDPTVLTLAPGRHELENVVPSDAIVKSTGARLAELVRSAQEARVKATVAISSKPEIDAPALQTGFCADIGGPAVDLITIPERGGPIVCAVEEKTVHMLAPDGKLVRTLTADGKIRMLRWWAEHELLLAGCADEQVIAFDRDGKRKWVFTSEMDPAVFRAAKTYWFKSAPGHEGIHGVHTGVFLDGKSQAFVGSACTLEILDENGKLIKRMPQFWGKVSHFRIVDGPDDSLNLLAAKKYAGHGAVRIISNRNVTPGDQGFLSVPPGHTYMRGWSNMSRQHILYEDVNGDGGKEVITDMNGAWNRVTVYTAAGKPLHDVSFGPGERIPNKNMRDLDIADLDGNGKKEIVSATSSGLVVALDCQCRKVWAKRLPSPATVMKIMRLDGKSPWIVVGSEDGTVLVLDAKGDFIRRDRVNGAPTCIAALDESGDTQGVLLATQKGEVRLFRAGE